MISVILGYSLAAPFVVANGRPGAFFHIRFPAVARSSFGIWGSYWLVFNRTVMSMVWFGVQAWIGGQCVSVFLSAIFPSYKRIPNGIPDSGTSTTGRSGLRRNKTAAKSLTKCSVLTQTSLYYSGFLGFFIYWLLSLPTVWPPIEKARHLFTVKAIV